MPCCNLQFRKIIFHVTTAFSYSNAGCIFCTITKEKTSLTTTDSVLFAKVKYRQVRLSGVAAMARWPTAIKTKILFSLVLFVVEYGKLLTVAATGKI